MDRILLHKDGTPVKIGDTVTSFRGDKWIVTGWPSTGRNRVWVSLTNEAGERQDGELFPSVFDLTWEDEQ